MLTCASSVRLRGTGGDLVILEEAAFIDESVFNEVVIPLLEVSNTALVGISTPLDKNNYYSSLVNLVDECGTKVFHVFEAKNACDKCIAELEDPSQCPHVTLERPAWKSKEKQKIVKALYKNNQTLLMRESMGIITEDVSGLFHQKSVEALISSEGIAPPKGATCVFVAIDPNGGGNSKFAICTGLRHKGKFTVSCLKVVDLGYSVDSRQLSFLPQSAPSLLYYSSLVELPCYQIRVYPLLH